MFVATSCSIFNLARVFTKKPNLSSLYVNFIRCNIHTFIKYIPVQDLAPDSNSFMDGFIVFNILLTSLINYISVSVLKITLLSGK